MVIKWKRYTTAKQVWSAPCPVNIALAVLDYMLPGINGFELLKQIRSRSRLPVVMLTARGDAVSRIVGTANRCR
jgi:DNA-binding response OmpR family regulator